MSSGWSRVNRRNRCPVCGRPDWCRFAPGGGVQCMRVQSNNPLGGGWMHDDPEFLALERPAPTVMVVRDDLDSLLWKYLDHAEANYYQWVLGSQLGVPAALLRKWGVGWTGRMWSIPEYRHDGKLVGISLRKRNGGKLMVKGSRHGVFRASDWQDHTGPILLPEGFTDTVCLDSLGIAAIGRPSNSGGIDNLTEMLMPFSGKRPIIVIAEADRKDDGRWPGWEGASRLSALLSVALDTPVGSRFPPPGAKDIRELMGLHSDDDYGKIQLLDDLNIPTELEV